MIDKQETIRKLLPEANRELLSRPNVIATGIGYKTVHGKKTGELCIVCSVETKVSAASLGVGEKIPSAFRNIPTDVVAIGPVNSLGIHNGRFRPAPGGVSIGHYRVSAGTAGCLVSKNDRVMILSNNHVLADSNQAAKGDSILQPGAHDGGDISKDQIARLSEFIPIRFENEKSNSPFINAYTGIFNLLARLAGSDARIYASKTTRAKNLVDCAIAHPLNGNDVTGEIHRAGRIEGTAEGTLDMEVKKSGRTTGLTRGVIQQVDVTVRVNFGHGKTALFTDQLMAGNMSQGGDSGSVVLNGNNQAIGLLFAGSPTTTIINRIQHVVNLLNIELL